MKCTNRGHLPVVALCDCQGVIPVGPLDVMKIAEAVLLNVFKIKCSSSFLIHNL